MKRLLPLPNPRQAEEGVATAFKGGGNQVFLGGWYGWSADEHLVRSAARPYHGQAMLLATTSANKAAATRLVRSVNANSSGSLCIRPRVAHSQSQLIQ